MTATNALYVIYPLYITTTANPPWPICIPTREESLNALPPDPNPRHDLPRRKGRK